MSILDQLNQSEDRVQREAEENNRKDREDQEKAIRLLTPALEYLRPLTRVGFKVYFNEDPGHQPCPAIHIVGSNMAPLEISFRRNSGTYWIGPSDRFFDTGAQLNDLEILGEAVSNYLANNRG